MTSISLADIERCIDLLPVKPTVNTNFRIIEDIHMTMDGTIPVQIYSNHKHQRGILRHMRCQVPSDKVLLDTLTNTVIVHPILASQIRGAIHD